MPKGKLILVLTSLLLTLLFTSCQATPQSGGASWDKPAADIENTLNRALSAYEQGDMTTATQLAKDAYYDVFESSGLETAIRLNLSSRRAFEVEYGFTEVNQLIRRGASAAEVQQAVTDLMGMIYQDAGRLSGVSSKGGSSSGFLQSFLIIVREGFEAILIIGAIIAYLVKSGNGNKVRIIYQSAAVAIAASIATAVAVRYLLNVSGSAQELLEGATMLLATAVLFSVSFWLLGKAQAQKWQQYIQSKITSSLTAGSTLALWSAAFLAVFREGAETVLFYQALLSGSRGSNVAGIWLGLGAGVLVLAAIFIAIRWGSLKVPVKPFFIGTGVFLYYMAFLFAGKGVRELQEAGSLGTTLIGGLPTIGLLGIFPTREGIILQGTLLLVAIAGLAYQFLFKSRSPAEAKKGNAM